MPAETDTRTQVQIYEDYRDDYGKYDKYMNNKNIFSMPYAVEELNKVVNNCQKGSLPGNCFWRSACHFCESRQTLMGVDSPGRYTAQAGSQGVAAGNSIFNSEKMR